jgi:hypothetical protein
MNLRPRFLSTHRILEAISILKWILILTNRMDKRTHM